MKKIFIGLVVSLAIAFPLIANAYTVKSGDTLSKVSKQIGVPTLILQKINHIVNPNKIYVGEILATPVRTINNKLLGVVVSSTQPLPVDDYDTFVTTPAASNATSIYVNVLPTGVSSSVYTIYTSDGVTPQEKIYCTGVQSAPNVLTGCTRGLSFYPINGVVSLLSTASGTTIYRNSRIAITDNINFTGLAISVLYGNQAIPSSQIYFTPDTGSIYGLATPTSAQTDYAATVGYVNSTTIAGAPNAATTVKGIIQLATPTDIGNGTVTGTTGAYLVPYLADVTSTGGTANKLIFTSTTGFIDPDLLNPRYNPTSTPTANAIPIASSMGRLIGWGTFGGTGADGALTLTSTTSTINCGGLLICIRNYTSISITGTGVLNFSNPSASGTIAIIKVQGNVTIGCTSTPCLTTSGMGATAGTGGANNSAGTSGSNALLVLDTANHFGDRGITGSSGDGGAGGAALTTTTVLSYTTDSTTLWHKIINLAPGAGGGGGAGGGTGGTGSAAGGAGGLGGGALYMEINGALSLTATNGISTSGLPGASSAATGGTNAGAGGGGGGSCGMPLILANTITSASGTITNAGGAGGNSGTGGAEGNGGGGGGGAGSYFGAGSSGGDNGGGGNAATSICAGGGGGGGTSGTTLGGAGGGSFAVPVLNNDFF